MTLALQERCKEITREAGDLYFLNRFSRATHRTERRDVGRATTRNT
jgi:hypothetical protein